MTLDQHPSGEGKNYFSRGNAGGILQDHQSKYAEPAKFVEDDLQDRDGSLFERINHIPSFQALREPHRSPVSLHDRQRCIRKDHRQQELTMVSPFLEQPVALCATY
jgi:hypothetical protein